MSACSSGSETLSPTKPPIGSNSSNDHRNRDALRFHSGRGCTGSLDKGVNPPLQIALSPLADPAAIDVERELDPALDEHGAGIDRTQANSPKEKGGA